MNIFRNILGFILWQALCLVTLAVLIFTSGPKFMPTLERWVDLGVAIRRWSK